ncbi:hypothetical protein PGB90_004155 [Kerria lacca]
MEIEQKDISESKTSNVILAKKTVDILHLMDTAELILKEKYGNNMDMWTDAIFQALMLKNLTYLSEETNELLNDSINLYGYLNDRVSKLTLKQNSKNYENVLDTSFTLINIFQKFTTFLSKCSGNILIDLRDAIQDLKQIENNIKIFICRSESSSNLESSVENMSEVKADTINMTVNSNNMSADAISSNLSTSEICELCRGKVVIFNNDTEFSISLHSQEKIHKKALKEKQKDDLEKKFLENHVLEKFTISAGKNDDQNQNVNVINGAVPLTVEDERAIRMSLNCTIGKLHSSFFKITSVGEFYCTSCRCQISCLKNIITHVKGKTHMKRTILKNNESTMSESDNIIINNSGTVSAKNKIIEEKYKGDDEIFRISNSSVPIKNLI